MSRYRTRFRTRSRGLRGYVLLNEYSLVQARKHRSADYLVGPKPRAVCAAQPRDLPGPSRLRGSHTPPHTVAGLGITSCYFACPVSGGDPLRLIWAPGTQTVDRARP